MSLASRRLFSAWTPYALGDTPGNVWWNSRQAKRAAVLDYKREPSDKTLPALLGTMPNESLAASPVTTG